MIRFGIIMSRARMVRPAHHRAYLYVPALSLSKGEGKTGDSTFAEHPLVKRQADKLARHTSKTGYFDSASSRRIDSSSSVVNRTAPMSIRAILFSCSIVGRISILRRPLSTTLFGARDDGLPRGDR